jgi:steroid delta-isomerase-like uncharacterized protein
MTSKDATRELIGRYFSAFNAGDVEQMISCVSEDVVHDVNQAERRVGKARFHAFCARMAHHYSEQLSDIEIMVSDDGSRAAAEFNVKGAYSQTEPGLPPAHGQSYAIPAGTFFAIRDGQISRVTTYYNLTEWIMQVTRDGGPVDGGVTEGEER